MTLACAATQLLDWVGQMSRDQLYLDRYRVMLTSGSSGRPGLFVYDAGRLAVDRAQVLRTSSWAGLRPSLPRQRVACSAAPPPPTSAAREPPPWRSACIAS